MWLGSSMILIKRQLSEGATECVFIASEALENVGESLDRESDGGF